MTREEAEDLRQNPRNWFLYVIYSCPEDPRVFVRNRLRVGWTVNFGHPRALFAIVAAAVFTLAPVAVLALAGALTPLVVMGTVGACVALLVLIVHYVATGPR